MIDELDYISFEPEAANLSFPTRPSPQLASPSSPQQILGRWDLLDDDTVAAARIDWLIHHVEVIIPARKKNAVAAPGV